MKALLLAGFLLGTAQAAPCLSGGVAPKPTFIFSDIPVDHGRLPFVPGLERMCSGTVYRMFEAGMGGEADQMEVYRVKNTREFPDIVGFLMGILERRGFVVNEHIKNIDQELVVYRSGTAYVYLTYRDFGGQRYLVLLQDTR